MRVASSFPSGIYKQLLFFWVYCRAKPSKHRHLKGVLMFGLGMPELLVILVIVVIVFGAGKLPEIGAGIGQGIKNFKKATRDADKQEKIEEKDKEGGSGSA